MDDTMTRNGATNYWLNHCDRAINRRLGDLGADRMTENLGKCYVYAT